MTQVLKNRHPTVSSDVRNEIKTYIMTVFLSLVKTKRVTPTMMYGVLERDPVFVDALNRCPDLMLITGPNPKNPNQVDRRPRWKSIVRELLRPATSKIKFNEQGIFHDGKAWTMKQESKQNDLSKLFDKEEMSLPTTRMYRDCLVVTVPAGMKVLVETSK